MRANPKLYIKKKIYNAIIANSIIKNLQELQQQHIAF